MGRYTPISAHHSGLKTGDMCTHLKTLLSWTIAYARPQWVPSYKGDIPPTPGGQQYAVAQERGTPREVFTEQGI